MSNRKYSVKECVDLRLNPLSLTGLCERSHWLHPIPSEIQEVPKSDRMNKPHISGTYCYSANHPQGWWFKRRVTLYWSGFYSSGRAWKGWLCPGAAGWGSLTGGWRGQAGSAHIVGSWLEPLRPTGLLSLTFPGVSLPQGHLSARALQQENLTSSWGSRLQEGVSKKFFNL